MTEGMYLNNCPICDSENFIKRYYADQYSNYSLCKKCKAIFKNPRFAEVDYEDVNLQSDELRVKGTFYGNDRDSPSITKIREYYMKRLVCLDRYTSKSKQNDSGNKKLIDVGCSTGLLMSIANELSYETCGIEISKFSGEKAMRYGPVFIGRLDDFRTKDKFDVVTCVNVIEHVPYPLETIKLMLNLVKDDGVIFMEFPVNEINRIRVQRMFVEKDICVPRGHLFQFNRSNISTMLKLIPNISCDVSYFGIISDRACRYAYVRERVLNRPKIKFIMSLLEIMPRIERLGKLEFFVNIIINKGRGKW